MLERLHIDPDTEFPLDPELVHLNHAAIGPWPARTRDAVAGFAAENAHQGSRRYLQWLETEAGPRRRLAAFIKAPSAEDIALVKNTSEGLSLVAAGLDWQPGDRVVTSAEEFPSNRVVWQALADRGVELVQVELAGRDDPEEALEAALAEGGVRLLAISSVQYASGLALDLARLGRACREHGALFGVDAIQSLGALAMDVEAIGADFIAADAHKWLLAPEGIGLFYCRPELRQRLALHQWGWHMVEHVGDFDRTDWEPAASARRFEPGSPNMLGIHALSASLSVFEEVGMERVEALVRQRAREVFERAAAHPDLEPITDPERMAGIVTFRHTGVDNAALWQGLMDRGVLCAHRGGGIRFSPHFHTAPATIGRALEAVDAVAAGL
ncbi:MAG: aminotransferase class V-fold PLP-dependent enzyme [Thiohalospira sp.]